MAAAVVRGREILASVIHAQVDVHAPYGGVVPELASRDHARFVSQVVGGWSKEIDVLVTPQAFRNSGRPDLPVGGRLAGLIARRALASHLWRDGILPEAGTLRLGEIGPGDVSEALREDSV